MLCAAAPVGTDLRAVRECLTARPEVAPYPLNHSVLSATIGSILAARRAGR